MRTTRLVGRFRLLGAAFLLSLLPFAGSAQAADELSLVWVVDGNNQPSFMVLPLNVLGRDYSTTDGLLKLDSYNTPSQAMIPAGSVLNPDQQRNYGIYPMPKTVYRLTLRGFELMELERGDLEVGQMELIRNRTIRKPLLYLSVQSTF